MVSWSCFSPFAVRSPYLGEMVMAVESHSLPDNWKAERARVRNMSVKGREWGLERREKHTHTHTQIKTEIRDRSYTSHTHSQ